MTYLSAHTQEQLSNPLDLLEEMVVANEWPFDRASEDEMVVEASGQWCDYRMYFIWRDDVSALYFTCAFDTRVPQDKYRGITELLSLINEKLWLGHFEINADDRIPMFRYTLLGRGWHGLSVEQFEDMVEIAICESERFYPAFQFVAWGGRSPEDALAATMLETMGEA